MIEVTNFIETLSCLVNRPESPVRQPCGRPEGALTLGDFAAARNPGTNAAAYNAEYARRMPGELY